MKKKIYKKSLIAFGFCFVTSPLTALAATEVESSEVVVSATRTEMALQDVVSSVSVVSEEEIARQGYSHVADMLQDVPGVEVSDTSTAGAKRVMIRGESGARVLVLVDGQKITEQKSMSGAPLLIDPAIIERIEVIKGPASVLYGSEAIGGVVNVITKKGGDRPIQATASVTYNSSTNGWEESLAVYGAQNGFTYRIGGTYSDQGDRKTPSGTLEGSSSQMQDINGALGYENENIGLGINFENFDSKADSPVTEVGGSLFDLNIPKWSRQKVGTYFDLKDVSEYIPKVHFDAYYQRTEKDFEQFMDMGSATMDMNTFNEQDTYAFNGQMDIAAGDNHYIITGFSVSRDELDAKSETTMSYPIGSSITSNFYDARVTTYALYAQDEWTLPEDFTLTLGARQTWVESELLDTDDSNADIGTVRDNKPVFSAGLTWTGADDLTLRGLFSQGYRFPDVSSLFIGTGHGGAITLANPDLDPETSNNFEVGARYSTGNWQTDISTFVNFAENYITTVEIGEGVRQYDNVDKAKTYGVEAYLAYSFPEYHLTPYTSFTWMKREYTEDGHSTWHTNTPEFSGRVGMKYERDFKAHPATLWGDFYMRAASEAKEEISGGEIEINDSWQTLNLSVGTDFGEDRQYQASLNFNNILDQSYRTAQNSIDEAGFHVVARLAVSF